MEYAFLGANVVLRYLLRDDETKAQRCLELLEKAERREITLRTTDLVIAELVWVLESPVTYNLPRDSFVKLDIYNINGQRIVSLVNEYQSAGLKTIFWDGKDARKIGVSSGVYFCRFEAGS